MLNHSEPAFYLDGVKYQSHHFTLPLNYDDYTSTPDHVSVYVRELVKDSR